MTIPPFIHRYRLLTLDRGQVFMFAILALLTAGAWALTVHQTRTMDMPMGVAVSGAAEVSESSTIDDGMENMPGMAMEETDSSDMAAMAASGMSGMGWSSDGLATFLIAWCVMMAAMMFPAAAPMVLFVQRVVAWRNGDRGAVRLVAVFVAAYLVVWSSIGIVTWALIRAVSDGAGRLAETERERWAPVALGIVLVVGGLYQFTPLKAVCLRHCQSPVSFVLTHWWEGHRGMVRMGIAHGTYCLGCCWALFAVLVAAGVMSLAWMLLLALVIFAEKALPFGNRTAHATGALLIVLGLFVAIGTTELPWSA